ncbi:hypothetical protein DRP77_03200 [Candidatus Poribacteria bacterium]|nr:MAG: hypothetical protein DRP77_03200 [Candidatus Poribacteria bacterium]
MRRGKLFPKICDMKTLWQAWQRVKRKGAAGGIDEVTVEQFERNLDKNLSDISRSLREGTYIPEPAKRIYIPKSNPGERRALSLPTVRDKIVQEAVRSVIEPLFNREFLDVSYAYRPGKGPRRAIGRVEYHLRHGRRWAATADIDDFFDSINHSLLIELVSRKIWEEEILRLIGMWLRMGVVYKGRWIDVEQGISQGGVISPLLSNIYLHPFDVEMTERGFNLIRYADDFIFLEETKEKASQALREAGRFLKDHLMLRLEPNSLSVRNVNEGFIFLGFLFKGNRKTISPEKIEKIKGKIREMLKGESSLGDVVGKLNESIVGWRNYYSIGDVEDQFEFLDNFLIQELRLFLRRREDLKEREVRDELRRLEFFSLRTPRERDNLISLIMAALRQPKLKPSRARKPVSSVEEGVAIQRRRYEKKLSGERDLIVSRPGSFIGKTSRRVVVREGRRKVKEIPLFRLRNIIITSNGVSISSDLIRHCSAEGISISFLDRYGRPYAQILPPKAPLYRLTSAQAAAFTNGKGVHLARCFAEGKIRNQINLIKYYRKYKRRKEFAFYDRCEECVERMRGLLKKLREIAQGNDLDSVRSQLFAIEGEAASLYWGLIKLLLINDVYFEGRERRGATDLVNSLLNYGYGILYSQVYQAIILAGLNPNISFLHKERIGKPTLVFDLVEEFRQPVVDRVVIGMIRKRRKLEMKGAVLSEETKQMLVEGVMARLSSRVSFRGRKMVLGDIIRHQANSIAGFLEDKTKYRPFVDKW